MKAAGRTAPPTPASAPPTSGFGPRPPSVIGCQPGYPVHWRVSRDRFRRRVQRFRNMAEGEGWRVSRVGAGDPGSRVRRSESAGGHLVLRSRPRARPRSRRARARPTAPSGSSAAARGTSCATTTSTASGRHAGSGGATWPAAASGRSAAAPKPR